MHTIPSISAEASGPSYSVVRLCEALAACPTDISLVALDEAGTAPPPFVKRFPFRGPRRLGSSPAMRRWLDGEAAAGRIDLIHNHSLWMMPNVYPGWTAGGYRLPYVVSPRGTFTEYAMATGSKVKRLFWPLVQRPALAAVTCFHATSEAECGDIRRMGYRQPVAVLPNGIDEVDYEAPSDKPMRTLLYLGRLHPEKGVETLLAAWARVQAEHPAWQLRIVGPGRPAYVEKVRRLAGELGLSRCEFADAAYGDAKWAAYRDADAYVLPSPSENFGMTVAEALVAGRPAIATRGAPWQGLEQEAAGWWPHYGVEPLAAALDSALSCPREVLAGMGRRGRAWMLRDFAWTAIGSRMSDLYGWLLGRERRPDFVVIE